MFVLLSHMNDFGSLFLIIMGVYIPWSRESSCPWNHTDFRRDIYACCIVH